ncbi:3-hydroxyacyl-CoA dehydrogenase/enoyl-CoA hydratase family protein [Agrobacterium tumefaciens]|nr:3-hydroxyacyl-CoA dehydrogenase/enoyl-CoA hydratase family protein [Agrobacterium tumefaciens]
MMKAILVETTGIRRVAVIGAGTMGGGIAAQFANAGVAVDLLDLKGADSGSEPAQKGLAQQLKAGGFMVPEAASLVRTGNIEDHLSRLSEADWVIEAVAESVEIKRDLFLRIAPHIGATAILSSNTSTLSWQALSENLEEDLRQRFAITHFFNPPRRMRLVELVTAPEASALAERLRQALQIVLGKTVVECRDTPGFLANRLGCFWMAVAALEARRLGLTLEEADAVHQALGLPATGVFGLFDLVGIDLVPKVWGSLMHALPDTDTLQRFDITGDPVFSSLVQRGALGRKAGGGFYRKSEGGAREALDLQTMNYRPLIAPAPIPTRDTKALLDLAGPVGAYARSVLGHVLAYAGEHAPAISDDPAAVDLAMELGYGWKKGPFAIAAEIGHDELAKRALTEQGFALPVVIGNEARSFAGFPSLLDLPVLAQNRFATLHDMADGVACFRAHSKLNTFDPAIFDLLEETLDRAGKEFSALVIANEDARAFSAGADLGFFTCMVDAPDGLEKIGAYGRRGQGLFLRMMRAPIPVIAAVHGFALGGGCEFQMHADAAIAHAEANIGLPEAGVGLVPGWGGCTRLYARAFAANPAASAVELALKVFDPLFSGKVSSSAAEAKALGLLRQSDGIAMHRGYLPQAAKERALTLLPGYVPAAPLQLPVSGAEGMEAILAHAQTLGALTDTDRVIAEKLAGIITGGEGGRTTLSEADFMALEVETLARLVTWPPSRARIEHMLSTGQRLKN